MFGFIKKLFGGIFSFLGGLFGSKKKGEFFMELDDAEKGTSGNSSKPALAAKAEAKSAASQNGKAESPKPAPAPAPVAVAAAPSKAQPATITTFAPNYLIAPSTASSRRRPGGSLKEFQTMARKLKSS